MGECAKRDAEGWHCPLPVAAHVWIPIPSRRLSPIKHMSWKVNLVRRPQSPQATMSVIRSVQILEQSQCFAPFKRSNWFLEGCPFMSFLSMSNIRSVADLAAAKIYKAPQTPQSPGATKVGLWEYPLAQKVVRFSSGQKLAEFTFFAMDFLPETIHCEKDLRKADNINRHRNL